MGTAQLEALWQIWGLSLSLCILLWEKSIAKGNLWKQCMQTAKELFIAAFLTGMCEVSQLSALPYHGLSM